MLLWIWSQIQEMLSPAEKSRRIEKVNMIKMISMIDIFDRYFSMEILSITELIKYRWRSVSSESSSHLLKDSCFYSIFPPGFAHRQSFSGYSWFPLFCCSVFCCSAEIGLQFCQSPHRFIRCGLFWWYEAPLCEILVSRLLALIPMSGEYNFDLP